MLKICGQSINKRIGIGKLRIYTDNVDVKREKIIDSESELRKLESAKSEAISRLNMLIDRTTHSIGDKEAAIFEMHKMLLEDASYLEAIRNLITEAKVDARYAIASVRDKYAEKFRAMDDEFMQTKADDIADVSNSMIDILNDSKVVADRSPEEEYILWADEISPSKLMEQDRVMLKGLVTAHGSASSHVAILARALNIPYLYNVTCDTLTKNLDITAIDKLYGNKICIVDGDSESIIFDPDSITLDDYQKKTQSLYVADIELQKYKDMETRTRSMRSLHLYANLNTLSELDSVNEYTAEGIGLVRSEFMFMGRGDLPSEQEQYEQYKKILQAMDGKPVIIRTIDIGADKNIDSIKLPKEDNPALGMRAIRVSLAEPDIFRTQIRALLRAAVYGDLSIMYPLIITAEEVKEILSIVDSIRLELDAEGEAYGNVCQGVMIETPAAVMISDELAGLVDFLSIGTNDLTQYTLAIDRQSKTLTQCFDYKHPAVMRMIKMVIDNAHAQGKWVGMCGEIDIDKSWIEYLIGLGIDELSVSPANVLPLRKLISEID